MTAAGQGLPRVERVADRAALARAAAEEVAQRAARAIEERGAFALALAGGSTPRALYELLAGRAHSDCTHWRPSRERSSLAAAGPQVPAA